MFPKKVLVKANMPKVSKNCTLGGKYPALCPFCFASMKYSI